MSRKPFALPLALTPSLLGGVLLGRVLLGVLLGGVLSPWCAPCCAGFPGISDPYLDQNLKLLPDINATGKGFYTFWWTTTFAIKKADGGDGCGARSRLRLRGINYRASVFLNGEELVPRDAKGERVTMAGMFHRFSLDTTDSLRVGGASNVLAILVLPPDVVGEADHGGQGGDHGMAENGAVMQYSEGWDWAVGVADRNTGPWDKIVLEREGEVTIRHPHVATVSVTTNRSQAGQEGAVLAVSATLTNAGKAAVSGTLSFRFVAPPDSAQPGGQLAGSATAATIPAGGSVVVNLPSVQAAGRALWWPYPLGEPVLHHVMLEFTTSPDNDRLSAEPAVTHELRIGLRTAEGIIDPVTGGRTFLINGQRVFLAGGNWIGTDQLLRLSADRYYDEVRMHREMGMNLIRVWGGGVTERPEFYEAADKLGVMVMRKCLLWTAARGLLLTKMRCWRRGVLDDGG